MGYLFGGDIIGSSSIPEGKKAENSQHEIFRPRTAGNRPTTDIRYKGDWMKRPISNDEVAWLANLLVKLSGWLNETLGLCPSENSHVGAATWSYVEVSGGTGANVCGPKDTMRLVLGAVCTWLITLGREAMKFMREHGMRVNLRMLASKKVVTVVLIAIVFSALKRMFELVRLPMLNDEVAPCSGSWFELVLSQIDMCCFLGIICKLLLHVSKSAFASAVAE
ncbi:hypothetical protein Tco_1485398 [Tanacetum coccineum]